MELGQWLHDRIGVLSIDADFFTSEEERRLAPSLQSWVARKVAAGVQIVFRDEHVDLVESIPRPIDFLINFDYHMDCRIEFLHGAEPKTPPCNATLFESVLSRDLVEKYVWAFPVGRSRQAASVYTSAFVSTGQQLLGRVHCVSGRYALDELLRHATFTLIFVCRSPEYATADTDAAFDRLRSSVGLSSHALS